MDFTDRLVPALTFHDLLWGAGMKKQNETKQMGPINHCSLFSKCLCSLFIEGTSYNSTLVICELGCLKLDSFDCTVS